MHGQGAQLSKEKGLRVISRSRNRIINAGSGSKSFVNVKDEPGKVVMRTSNLVKEHKIFTRSSRS